jgi:hypothetical protein
MSYKKKKHAGPYIGCDYIRNENSSTQETDLT